MPAFRIRTAISGGPGGAELATMYFDTFGGLLAQDAANAVHDFWNTMKGYIHSAYTMQVEGLVTIIDETTGHPTSAVTTTTAAVVGTDSGDPLPPATQGLVRWHTGIYLGGRELQGKTYIPGVCEPENTGGVPIAPYLASLNSAATTLKNYPTASLSIYSRKNRQLEVVTGESAWNKWAVLRSRRD